MLMKQNVNNDVTKDSPICCKDTITETKIIKLTLLTGCEIQRHFQELLKQIQGPLVPNKIQYIKKISYSVY